MEKQSPDLYRPIRDAGEEFWVYFTDIPNDSIVTLITVTQRYDFRLVSNNIGLVEVLSHHDWFLHKNRVIILGSGINGRLDPYRRFGIGYSVIFSTSFVSCLTTTALVELQVDGRRILPIENTF